MLADLVRSKRADCGLREVSLIAGISPATISRIDSSIGNAIASLIEAVFDN